MCADDFFEFDVCKTAGLAEAIHGAADFDVDVDVAVSGNKVHEVVLIDDFLWDVFDVDSHVFETV